MDNEPVRNLQSSSKNLDCISSVSTALASHGIRRSAASVRNSLPNNIRDAKTCDIVKRRLKTHLCEIAFGTKQRGQRPCLLNTLYTARKICYLLIYLLTYVLNRNCRIFVKLKCCSHL